MKSFFVDDTEDHVTELGAANGTKTVEKGGILVLTRGMTLLRDVPICLARRRITFNQDVKGIVPNDGVHSSYLAYALVAAKPDLLSFVELAGHGTGRLPTDRLANIQIRLPPLREQHAVALALGALDEKIELNQRASETLEAMVRTLFHHSRLQDSRNSLRVEDLVRKGLLTIGDGYRAKRSELSTQGLPFARAGNINGGFRFEDVELLGAPGVLKAGAKVSKRGDVVFTSKGTVGRFALVTGSTPDFVYSPQLCFWRSLKPKELRPAFLFFWMQSSEFLEQVSAVKGQTDMADYVSLRDQLAMRISLPEPSTQAEFAEQAEPLLEKKSSNVAESQSLAGLRDTLLPKLLSGQLRIKDAEKIVGEAT
jgi:type I restriction enzyme S subunit